MTDEPNDHDDTSKNVADETDADAAAQAAEETANEPDATTGASPERPAASTMPIARPSATPAPAPAKPAPVGPAEPLPVAIAKTRKRPPIWAAVAIAALPLWGILYLNSMTKPPASDPLTLGGQLFASAGCAGCHGSNGEGGTGPQLNNGKVLKTWPKYADQIKWVTLGSAGYQKAGHTTYGDGTTPIGTGSMPAFGGTLSDQEIAQIVYYERVTFGQETASPDLQALATMAGGSGG